MQAEFRSIPAIQGYLGERVRRAQRRAGSFGSVIEVRVLPTIIASVRTQSRLKYSERAASRALEISTELAVVLRIRIEHTHARLATPRAAHRRLRIDVQDARRIDQSSLLARLIAIFAVRCH